jgi:hypothetical protein
VDKPVAEAATPAKPSSRPNPEEEEEGQAARLEAERVAAEKTALIQAKRLEAERKKAERLKIIADKRKAAENRSAAEMQLAEKQRGATFGVPPPVKGVDSMADPCTSGRDEQLLRPAPPVGTAMGAGSGGDEFGFGDLEDFGEDALAMLDHQVSQAQKPAEPHLPTSRLLVLEVIDEAALPAARPGDPAPHPLEACMAGR